MKKILLGASGVLVLGLAAVAVLLQAGMVDVAADTPHNYDAMCVNCHLSPGVKDSEIRNGLYPTPPNLAGATESTHSSQSDARRFWIIKHGIKASGMPAWSKGGMNDEAIWDLTAFLKALPSLTPETYRRQVEASEGHSHEGLVTRGDKEERTKPVTEQQRDTTPHTHEKGAHKH